MTCGKCDLTDGLCYTSNPPQVKCTVTGEFHTYDHECDAVSTATIIPAKYCISCLICDDTIELYDYPAPNAPKICDKCKAAIMSIREKLEKENENGK